MMIPYDQFESRYLRIARALTSESRDPTAAVRLCRRVYDLVNDHSSPNSTPIHVLIAQVHYQTYVDNADPPTATFARRCFPHLISGGERWISFEELQRLLTPILFKLSLYRRLIAALEIHEWNPGLIEAFLNKQLEASAPELQGARTLEGVARVLAALRCRLDAELANLDAAHAWIRPLIVFSDPEGDYATWTSLRDLANTPVAQRFARWRKGRLYKYAVLWARWREALDFIRDHLSFDALLHDELDEADDEK
jgi:hypothetical protein